MNVESLAGRDLVSLMHWTSEEVAAVLTLAAEMKANPAHYAKALVGKSLFMYFEKPSLRTRVTFEAGMTQLGGHAIYYSASDGKIGVRESVEDVARNLDRWVDGVMCRTFSHALVEDLAKFTGIPVISWMWSTTTRAISGCVASMASITAWCRSQLACALRTCQGHCASCASASATRPRSPAPTLPLCNS